MRATISNEIVRLQVEYYGKGPTRVAEQDLRWCVPPAACKGRRCRPLPNDRGCATGQPRYGSTLTERRALTRRGRTFGAGRAVSRRFPAHQWRLRRLRQLAEIGRGVRGGGGYEVRPYGVGERADTSFVR